MGRIEGSCLAGECECVILEVHGLKPKDLDEAGGVHCLRKKDLDGAAGADHHQQ
jgi:hypothetical protein